MNELDLPEVKVSEETVILRFQHPTEGLELDPLLALELSLEIINAVIRICHLCR